VSSGPWLEIARLRRVRGLKGEIFAETGQRPEWFTGLAGAVRIRLAGGAWFGGAEPAELRIESARPQGELTVFRFAGIDSAELAQPLVNGTVCLAREERPAPPEGEHWMTDLVGCEVYDRKLGRVVGTVQGWEEYGPRIVLAVQLTGGGEPVLVPFVRSICVAVEPEKRRIEIEAPEGLLDLNATPVDEDRPEEG
jgi:16S rRNA processing protein RimM